MEIRRGHSVVLVWAVAFALLLVEIVLGVLSGALLSRRPAEQAQHPQDVKKLDEVPATLVVLAHPRPRREVAVPPAPKSAVALPPPTPVGRTASEPIEAGGDEGFPALVASYDGLGLDVFLAGMRQMGARLFVGSLSERRLVAEVDPLSYAMWTGFRPVTGLAVDRPRIIRDDRAAFHVLRQASAAYGPGEHALVLLVPQELEQRILAAFRRDLAPQGRPLRDFVSVRGNYRRGPRGLVLHLEEAVDRSGLRVPLRGVVDLAG